MTYANSKEVKFEILLRQRQTLNSWANDTETSKYKKAHVY